jgi:hypothetical protein
VWRRDGNRAKRGGREREREREREEQTVTERGKVKRKEILMKE